MPKLFRNYFFELMLALRENCCRHYHIRADATDDNQARAVCSSMTIRHYRDASINDLLTSILMLKRWRNDIRQCQYFDFARCDIETSPSCLWSLGVRYWGLAGDSDRRLSSHISRPAASIIIKCHDAGYALFKRDHFHDTMPIFGIYIRNKIAYSRSLKWMLAWTNGYSVE